MKKGYDSICCFRNRHDDGYRILLEITNRCNENCVFCHAKDKQELSLDDIKRIIGNLEAIKIHDVILTGGEPLLHKELFSILEWFKEVGIECDLCTNATLVTEEIAENLAKYLSEISVSLDTVNDEVFDRLRGTRGGLKRTLQGIENLQRAGIDVHLTDVLTKQNHEEISQVIEKARELKVHSISFLAVIVDVAKNKQETSKIALSDEEKKKAMEVLTWYRDNVSDLLINSKRLCECPNERCRAGENVLGITSDGKLLGCIMHRDKEVDILNTKFDESILAAIGQNTQPC